jgi:hypothetical protein
VIVIITLWLHAKTGNDSDSYNDFFILKKSSIVVPVWRMVAWEGVGVLKTCRLVLRLLLGFQCGLEI